MSHGYIKMLLARPSIQSSECLISYLIRVSEQNGFKHIGHLLQYAGLEWKNNRAPVHQILTGEFSLEKLFENVGLKYTNPETASTYSTFRKSIDSLQVFVKSPKVCPQCLEENGYCEARWAYLPISACFKHKMLLVDTHQRSGIRLSWYRKNLNRFDTIPKPIAPYKMKVSPSIIQFSKYFESLVSQNAKATKISTVLLGMDFRSAVAFFNFLAHYQTRLMGEFFRPVSLDNLSLAAHYQGVWEMTKNWPDSFYELLSQYIDKPMSRKGVAGINKHYRDLSEGLHRYQENEGIARIKIEFNRYIETYWPGYVETGRLTRINLSSLHRGVISKKEAGRIIGCRPERIDKFVQFQKLSPVIFKGKVHYSRDEVETIANQIKYNWTMDEACEALQLTRYQLKQLLNCNIIHAIQKPDSLNRDWIVDKANCEEFILGLQQQANKKFPQGKTYSLEGIQRQGFSIPRLVLAMQSQKIRFRFVQNSQYSFSFLQFTSFQFK